MRETRFEDLLRSLSLVLLLTGCGSPEPVPHVVLGAPISAQASLIWLADDLGYFTARRIDVDMRPYPSGKRALAGMLGGEVEFAVTAETPFAIAAFEHPGLRLYATIGKSDNDMRILARRDHAIATPSDLKAKTIATQRASAVHFFLSSFLLYQGVNPGQVSLAFMKAEELPTALASGEVDAISMREPFLSRAKKLVDERKLIEFGVPGLYTKTYNIAGPGDFVVTHPGVMERFLAALNDASRFAETHPDEAIAIIAARLGVRPEALARLWPDLRLRVTLNQGLLTTLREEAHWALSEGIVVPGSRGIPDFLALLDPTPLEQALPHAVGLIGIEP